MPRPIRIEYEDAFYHVMSRGRDKGRQNIFHSKEYYQSFLETLAEACERFGVVVHAYCLMTNHYHLLLQTPHPNLGRVMRHINGVYTQRYNRLKKTDGPLFRGRYKSILVDEDNYLLQLSRYIHRNPIETKRPMVEQLENYVWSSYPAYINQTASPDWLYREKTYQMLGKKNRYQGYAKFVAQGNESELLQFYNRGNTASVIGDKDFVDWLRTEKIPEIEDKLLVKQVLPKRLGINQILQLIADYYDTDIVAITDKTKGKKINRPIRKISMHICQQLGGYPLKEIKEAYGLTNIGSVSFTITTLKKEIAIDKGFADEIKALKSYIIEKAN